MPRIYVHQLASPLGSLCVRWRDGCLLGVDLSAEMAATEAEGDPPPPAVLRALTDRLQAYFTDPAVPFADLPLADRGTAYQQRVWSALRAIPAGQTRTYGELGHLLQSGARAVGQACRANPWLILVPCHRVVARQGLGGFAGDRAGRRLAVKRWLLHHEGLEFEDGG